MGFFQCYPGTQDDKKSFWAGVIVGMFCATVATIAGYIGSSSPGTKLIPSLGEGAVERGAGGNSLPLDIFLPTFSYITPSNWTYSSIQLDIFLPPIGHIPPYNLTYSLPFLFIFLPRIWHIPPSNCTHRFLQLEIFLDPIEHVSILNWTYSCLLDICLPSINLQKSKLVWDPCSFRS